MSPEEIYDSKYKESIKSYEDFESICKLDPTSKFDEDSKLKKMGKYCRWILSIMPNENNWDEDKYKITNYLKIYDKAHLSGRIDDRGIFKYKSIPDLYDSIKDLVTDSDISNRSKVKSEKDRIIDEQSTLFYEDDEVVVRIPNTYEASCILGADTSWCTATRNTTSYYSRYTSRGKLYIIKDKETSDRYQIHWGYEEASMDISDRYISPTLILYKYPQLIDAFFVVDYIGKNYTLYNIREEVSPLSAPRLMVSNKTAGDYDTGIYISVPFDDPSSVKYETAEYSDDVMKPGYRKDVEEVDIIFFIEKDLEFLKHLKDESSIYTLDEFIEKNQHVKVYKNDYHILFENTASNRVDENETLANIILKTGEGEGDDDYLIINVTDAPLNIFSNLSNPGYGYTKDGQDLIANDITSKMVLEFSEESDLRWDLTTGKMYDLKPIHFIDIFSFSKDDNLKDLFIQTKIAQEAIQRFNKSLENQVTYNKETRTFDIRVLDYSELANLFNSDERKRVGEILDGSFIDYYDYMDYDSYMFDHLSSFMQDIIVDYFKRHIDEYKYSLDDLDDEDIIQELIGESGIDREISRAMCEFTNSELNSHIYDKLLEEAIEWLTGKSDNESFKKTAHIISNVGFDVFVNTLYSYYNNHSFMVSITVSDSEDEIYPECIDFDIDDALERDYANVDISNRHYYDELVFEQLYGGGLLDDISNEQWKARVKTTD